ncbi:hypothetical protein NAT51_08500 [Flavobacterium amniphilum]|nr:hypothetical protein [Flavobacterium amniphilum]MCL9805560.1 hypothetical protein [Flavobacterium amniphilum]
MEKVYHNVNEGLLLWQVIFMVVSVILIFIIMKLGKKYLDSLEKKM